MMGNISTELRSARIRAGLTQAQVAALMNTKQAAISRLESPNYAGHTLESVVRFAEAVNARVKITITRAEDQPTATNLFERYLEKLDEEPWRPLDSTA